MTGAVLTVMAGFAGLCTTAAVAAPLCQAGTAARLLTLTRTRGVPASTPPAIGLEAALESIIARLKGGSSLVTAFAEQGAVCFATPQLTKARIARVLVKSAAPGEHAQQVRRLARQTAQACLLSEHLGCEASLTLEAALASYRRERLAGERRAQAMAAPDATIRLLTALPIVTVALGEVLGAHPIMFLLSSPQGLLCLTSGLVWYAAGMAWVQHMLRVLRRKEAP